MKKLLSVFLALVMVFALCGGALAAEGAVDTDAPTDTTGETPTDPATDEAPAEPEGDLAGKIVILHTNDVHGAITTYDKVAAMKADYEARGAEARSSPSSAPTLAAMAPLFLLLILCLLLRTALLSVCSALLPPRPLPRPTPPSLTA